MYWSSKKSGIKSLMKSIKMQLIFFVASTLLPLYDLKAHEHNKAGRTTSQLRNRDLPTSHECSINMHQEILVRSGVMLIYKSSHGADRYLLSFSRTQHEGLNSHETRLMQELWGHTLCRAPSSYYIPTMSPRNEMNVLLICKCTLSWLMTHDTCLCCLDHVQRENFLSE